MAMLMDGVTVPTDKSDGLTVPMDMPMDKVPMDIAEKRDKLRRSSRLGGK